MAFSARHLKMTEVTDAWDAAPLVKGDHPRAEGFLAHRSQRSKANAFTLIELLIVIAIIAIIASLLLPSFGRSKASARRAFCQNNLRQLVIGLEMYGNDFGQYPEVMTIEKAGKSGTSICLWNAFLLPYLGSNLNLFYCPSFPESYRWGRSPSVGGWQFPTNIQGNRPFCYALNQLGLSTFGSLGLEAGPGAGRKLSEIRVPANMIAVGDDTVQTNKFGGWGAFTFSFDFGASDPTIPMGRVHNSGGNMAFVDSHVEWGRPDIWLERSESAARRWNYDNEPHREFWSQ
jgi:prepilin-type N-terminal cleavage/methylation domain-containing protein/prepilin-type processing-associated H-X9-DG protein